MKFVAKVGGGNVQGGCGWREFAVSGKYHSGRSTGRRSLSVRSGKGRTVQAESASGLRRRCKEGAEERDIVGRHGHCLHEGLWFKLHF